MDPRLVQRTRENRVGNSGLWSQEPWCCNHFEAPDPDRQWKAAGAGDPTFSTTECRSFLSNSLLIFFFTYLFLCSSCLHAFPYSTPAFPLNKWKIYWV